MRSRAYVRLHEVTQGYIVGGDELSARGVVARRLCVTCASDTSRNSDPGDEPERQPSCLANVGSAIRPPEPGVFSWLFGGPE